MGFSFLLPYFHIFGKLDDFYSEIVKCIKSNAGNNTFTICIWGCQQWDKLKHNK